MELTLIVAVICGILFPSYVLLTGKKTIKILEENPDKLPLVYKETIILLIVMAVLVLVSLNAEAIKYPVIGLSFINQPIWIVLLAVTSAVAYWLINKITIPESKVEYIGKGLEGVQHVLPKNQVEYKWAVITSFVAGVCEEIIFRGFLVWQLSPVTHELIAIFIANVLFGIAHATSKLNNAIKATGLGLLFSILYYVSGSLWLPILAHIIVDLYAATVSFKYAEWKSSK